jgi:DNA gyrase subunit A
MVTAKGQAIRFKVKSLRSASRLSGGVRGIKLRAGDRVVAMEIAQKDHALLVVSALGHGKRTPMDDYPIHGRGGQGVITFKTHSKSGELVTARMVDPDHEVIFISEAGIVLRTPVAHISLQGRPTQGVKLMDVEGDKVAAVAVIDMRKEYDTLPLPVGANGEEETNGSSAKTKDGAKKSKAEATDMKPQARGSARGGGYEGKKSKPSGNGRTGSNGRGKKGK